MAAGGEATSLHVLRSTNLGISVCPATIQYNLGKKLYKSFIYKYKSALQEQQRVGSSGKKATAKQRM